MIKTQISWEDVRYIIEKPKKREEDGEGGGVEGEEGEDEAQGCCAGKVMEKKVILHKMSGVVQPGRMLAIMGPSGSGKTTLLNVLSGVIPRNKREGEVKLNGVPAMLKVLQANTGYVPQDDILNGAFNVFESMMFYAKLKLPNVTHSERKRRVEDLIAELGLTRVRDSIVGYVGDDAGNSGLKRGISGGERKRLSIGQQLITDPSLLFLDEPTTGLDSFAAESVVNTLVQQANNGRTIIFTIHQPSSDIFNQFHDLLILAHGRTMYFGPAKNAIKYFGRPEVGYPCPQDSNPGEHFVEIIFRDPKSNKKNKFKNKKNKEKSEAEIKKEKELQLEKQAEGFKESKNRAEMLERKFLAYQKELKAIEPAGKSDDDYNDNNNNINNSNLVSDRAKADIFTQLNCLLHRNIVGMLRDPASARAGIFQSILLSLIMGALFFNLDNDQKSLTDRAGGLFFGLIFLMFGGMLGPFNLFVAERKEFLFQYREGLYGCGAYYIGKVLPQIPMIILNATLFAVIYYFMLGLRTDAAYYFFIFLGVIILMVITSFSFTMFLVGIFPDTKVALALFPIFFLPLMLFSGFYLNSDTTPPWFIWIEYISFMKYTFRPVIRNELSGQAFYCRPTELVSGVCQYTVGDQWLVFRKLNDVPVWGDALVLIAMIIIYNFFGFLLLKRIANATKK